MQLPKKRETHQISISVEVDAVAYQKFMCWVDIARGEVSALGLVEEFRDEDSGRITGLRVTDFFLVKQKCTPDETDMDPAGVAELLVELESNGYDSGKLRCWAHSHAIMDVFWSGTDERCIDGLANDDWLLSLVVNKRRDTLMRLDQYHPCHFYMDNVAWELHFPAMNGLEEACLEQFKVKVNENPPLLPAQEKRTLDTIDELYAAHERGALTEEELEEEMDMIGWEDNSYGYQI